MANLSERANPPPPDSPGRWTRAADTSPWRVADAWVWVSSANVTRSRWWGRSGVPDGGEAAPHRHLTIPSRGVGVEWWCSFHPKALVNDTLGAVSVASKARHLILIHPRRTPVMECKRGDPALPSLGTDPPGACCWSPPGSEVGLAVSTLLTRVVVCCSHAAAGCIADTGTRPPACCAPLGAGCGTAITGTVPPPSLLYSLRRMLL